MARRAFAKRRDFIATPLSGVPHVAITWMTWLAQEFSETMCFPTPGSAQHSMILENPEVHTAGKVAAAAAVARGAAADVIAAETATASQEAAADGARLRTMPTFQPSLLATIRTGAGGKRLVAWILVLRTDTGEPHANGIVLDMKRGHLIRFEPRGCKRTSYSHAHVDEALRAFARVYLQPQLDFVQVVTPKEYQAAMGCQTVEMRQALRGRESLPAHGPCVSWVLVFMHLMLLFPDQPVEHAARVLKSLMHSMSPTMLVQAYANVVATKLPPPAKLKKEAGPAARCHF